MDKFTATVIDVLSLAKNFPKISGAWPLGPEGEEVGAPVGKSVGWPDGCDEGIELGQPVGIVDGWPDGISVG